MRRGEAGFTIIEVIIVLAVAGMLLIGAFVALTSSIETTRFTDALNSTQSYFQKQYLDVATGTNDRTSNTICDASASVSPGVGIPGGSECILLGRLLTINPNSSVIESRYILGIAPASSTTYTTDNAALAAYNPKTTESFRTQFDMLWGSRINTITRGATTTPFIAIMRSPISERILIYSNTTSALNLSNPTQNLNKKVDLCIDSGGGLLGKTGHLVIGSGQGQDLFGLERLGSATC